MREYKYEPKKDFKGHITVALLRNRERMKLFTEFKTVLKEDGTVDVKGDDLEKVGQIDFLYEVFEKQLKELELEHIESGKKFTTLEEFDLYNEALPIVSEVAGFLISGSSLGKSSKNK